MLRLSTAEINTHDLPPSTSSIRRRPTSEPQALARFTSSGRLTSGAARAFAADRPVAQAGVLAWMVEAGETELAFWVVASLLRIGTGPQQ